MIGVVHYQMRGRPVGTQHCAVSMMTAIIMAIIINDLRWLVMAVAVAVRAAADLELE